MAKTARAIFIILLVAATTIASGCSAERSLARRVDAMLEGGDAGRQAQRAIIDEADSVYPVLLSWLESADARKSQRAQSAFMALGEDARQYLLVHFSTMSESARPLAVEVLAAPADKEAILRLISLMRFPDARDSVVRAITAMGEPAAAYLASQLHSTHYSDAIDAVLAAFGETAVPLVVPALKSENADKARRAINILIAIGEPAIPGMVSGLLGYRSGEEALLRAGEAFARYPEAAISAVLHTVCSGEGAPEAAAAMLSSLDASYWPAIFSYQPATQDTGRLGQVLAHLIRDRVTVPGALDMAISSADDALWQGVGSGLLSGGFADETMVEILSRIGASADTDGLLARAAEAFLPEGISRELVRALCADDAQAFRALVQRQDAEGLRWLGRHLSQAEDNEAVYSRCARALEESSGETRQALLAAYASGTGNRLPALVMGMLSSADEAMKQAALTALAHVEDEDGNLSGPFLYEGLDYTDFLEGWSQCLLSPNDDLAALAHQMLARVPVGSDNHRFFDGLFTAAPGEYLLEVLSGHYWEENGIRASLRYPPDAADAQEIAAVALTISGGISRVAADDAPDMKPIAVDILKTLGLRIIESAEKADLLLDVAYSGQPLSKHYPGLAKASYPGARFTLVLRTTDGVREIRTDTECTLAPPDTITATNATEYLPDPNDAPLTDCFMEAYIDGLYRLFGRETLFVLYRDFPESVLPLARPLWESPTA